MTIELIVERIVQESRTPDGRRQIDKAEPVRLAGWTSARIDRSISKIADSFAFQYADRWYPDDEPYVLTPDLVCRVELDGELAIVGWSIVTSERFEAERYELNCEGYSLPGLMNKSSAIAKTGQFKNTSFKTIVAELTKNFNFGVDYDMDGDENTVIKSYCIDEGELTDACLERLCRMFGALMTPQPSGRLKIWRTDAATAEDYDFFPQPKVFEHVKDFSERCSEYLVVGEAPTNANSNGRESAQALVQSIIDGEVLTYSPVIVTAEGPGDPAYLKQRAVYELNVRAGRSEYINVTYPGMRDRNGRIISPGGFANFSFVPSNGFTGRPIEPSRIRMLVESVRTTLDGTNGIESTYTLVDPATYSINPIPPEVKA